MPKKRAKQDWQSTKMPNLFTLDGIYYLRVKPQGQKRIRASLGTDNFNVARTRTREKMLEVEKPWFLLPIVQISSHPVVVADDAAAAAGQAWTPVFGRLDLLQAVQLPDVF